MVSAQGGAFDLVIVGGGFAGLAAARAAALRGLATLVIEAKPSLGARLHTTGIFVREAADACDIPAAFTHRIAKVRLYGPSRRSLDLEAPGYYFLTTDTAAVLRWLGDEAARAGATIRTACRFEGVVRDGRGWRVLAGDEGVRTRYLLGCDGARSPVAAALGLSANRRFLSGVEREYSDPARLDRDRLHIFLDSRTAPGYIAWAAANPKGAQVGLAVSHGRKPQIDGFTREAEALFGLACSQADGRRAGLIPCGGLVPHWACPGAMLIGDAAGMVSPLTGGGIHPALALGRRAGQAVADYLSGCAPSPEQVVRTALPRWALKRGLRGLMDLAPPNWLLERALSTAPMAAFARQVLFHQRPGRDQPSSGAKAFSDSACTGPASSSASAA